MSTVQTLDKADQLAADELIAVTGDKTIQRTWNLADAIIQASPGLAKGHLGKIRDAAIAKAGHDEFWKVGRLTQLGKTAKQWPKGERVPDVSLDAHMEAYRAKGSTTEARQVILEVQKANGSVSIRGVRAALGKNGTTAQPPRIDKAGVDEVWRRLAGMKAHLKKHLRGRLRADGTLILEFADLFNELAGMVAAVTSPDAAASVETVDDPQPEQAAPAVRRNRRKGL